MRFSPKILSYTCLFLLCHVLASGQELQVNVQSFGTAEGLSHRDALSIQPDTLGFIWVGTKYGLNRFDGHDFQWFTKEKNGLVDNEIDYILEDNAGWFWLLTTGGKSSKRVRHIGLFNPYTRETLSLEEKFGEGLAFRPSDIATFLRSPEGRLVFLNDREEVITWSALEDKLSVHKIRYDRSLQGHTADAGPVVWATVKDDPSTFVAFDSEGRIRMEPRMETGGKLISSLRVKNGQMSFLLRDSEDLTAAQAYTIDTTGRITHQGDFFQRLSPEFKKTLREKTAGRDLFLRFDPASSRYFVKASPFLFFLDPQTGHGMELTLDHPELAHVNEIFFLDERRVFVGTPFGLQLLNFQENAFRRYLHRDPAAPNFVQDRFECRAITEVATGEIWINTYQGTYGLTRDPEGNIEAAPSAALIAGREEGMDQTTHALFRDSRGDIWIGLRHPTRYRPSTGKIHFQENPDKDYLWAMYEDKNGRLWFSFETHVDFLSEGKLHRVNARAFPEFENAFVIHFHKDRSGKVWLASQKGLFVLDTERRSIGERYWTGGPEGFQLPADHIYHIHEDEQGDFWLATNSGGLVHWQRSAGTFTSYTRADGLSSNVLYAVYEDQRQNLWMPSDRGIIRFNKATKKTDTFIEEDGPINNEYNRLSHFQAADGTLYFGGINGVTVFHPDSIAVEVEKENPPLVISSFRQFDGQADVLRDKTLELQTTRRMTIRPNDRFFTLHFALQGYKNPENVRYAYFLEGLDDRWTHQRENSLRIARLPYGDYTLHIKGQTSDGHWSDRQLAIAVQVVRPVYLQGWFLLLALLLLVCSAWLGVRRGIRTQRLAKQRLKWQVDSATEQIRRDKQTIEEQAADLRKLDQIKSRFFANISHELRTPLTLILGPLHSALEKGEVDNRTRRWLQTARNSSQNLLHLVNSILDFSKLDAEKLELHESTFPLGKELSLTAAQFHSHAERHGIYFHFENEIPADVFVRLDLAKLQTILNNLLSNAIKYTGDGGEVVLRCHDRTDQLLISVEDTGRGIHSDDVDRIFQRFYQSRHGGSIAEGGSGIGLALCRELTRMMRGRIWVESEWGKGSRFFVELPKVVVEEEEQKNYGPVETDLPLLVGHVGQAASDDPLKSPPAAAETPSVLIVEDNPDLREYLTGILSEKYTVQTAKNGQEALDYLLGVVAKGPEDPSVKMDLPDLILSDIMMPRMNGLQLLDRLKSHEQFKRIPVIMLTARAELEDKLNALRIGVDDYLVKPFVEEELLARIRNLLQNAHNRRLFRQEQPEEETDTALLSEADAEWLAELEAMIYEDMADSRFSVSWLADRAAISQRQLNRRLNQLIGLSANQYVHELRMHQARKLLEKGSYRSVAEVAYAVGYNSPRAFSRAYQERFGRLPSGYW